MAIAGPINSYKIDVATTTVSKDKPKLPPRDLEAIAAKAIATPACGNKAKPKFLLSNHPAGNFTANEGSCVFASKSNYKVY